MTRTRVLILINVAMLALFLAAVLALDLIGARDEVLVAVFILILGGGALAASEVIGHYAERDEHRPR
ncbi:MAG TPA: hypothetical protein VEQ41_02365 [Solirubrobacterales bacterium]|nr:hypothetical protein [Solirubrobacterales bacterium]